MHNYGKILVVVTYRKNVESLLQHDGEVPTVLQIRHPVAHTPVVFAVVALRNHIVVRHFLCS
jgi:hypothetical protein